MKSKGTNVFWTSFTDLMTALFFVMLVLFVITYNNYQKELIKKQEEVINLKHKLEVYDLVEQILAPLRHDTTLFKYEPEYKRFILAFDVNFRIGYSAINREELNDYYATVRKIDQAGHKLKIEIDKLAESRKLNPKLKNVSYLLVIAGYASHLQEYGEQSDYDLSFQRAYNLKNYWKYKGIDFDAAQYKDFIDLQIAGNGWGGIGRFPGYDSGKINRNLEQKNQRFIIQIVPKIGDTNSE